jgi:hypothetical protein
MHISQRVNNITQIPHSLPDRNGSHPVQLIEECPRIHVLHYHINLFLLPEHTVKFNDVGVVEAGMKTDLFRQLIGHLQLLHPAPLDFLYSRDETGSLVTGQEHLPKFASPQNTTNLEPIDHL